jgi:hypothetical protein
MAKKDGRTVPWSAKRRREHAARMKAAKRGVRTMELRHNHHPDSPDTGLEFVHPNVIEVLVDGRIRECRLHAKVYVPVDA